LKRVSASAYSDLRRCPYRYFALQMLGLREADEMEVELDKRDFGLWLHAVLKHFHDQLKDLGHADAATLLSLLDAAAQQTTQTQGLAEDEFLPFMAAWPGVRDGYLVWLQKHQTEGARFDVAEQWLEQALGPLTLVGRVDRIDKTHAPGFGGDGENVALVIDYKTESLGVTKDRIKTPLEDTQLAFYAALLPHDTLRAAYVNLGEKTGTVLVEQDDVVHVRDALVEGLLHDMGRIAEGALLPALGEGTACEFCAARGLCRKDFWSFS
jgi:ATP-dependent helicase/nuclease subunit B